MMDGLGTEQRKNKKAMYGRPNMHPAVLLAMETWDLDCFQHKNNRNNTMLFQQENKQGDHESKPNVKIIKWSTVMNYAGISMDGKVDEQDLVNAILNNGSGFL